MREPEVYDVWLMRVEFPDHPGVGKVKPVIVTRVEEDRVSGIVVKVTSVTTWNGPGDVPLLDWRHGSVQAIRGKMLVAFLVRQW